MKNILIVFILSITFFSCQKTTEIGQENQSMLLYNKEMFSFPIPLNGSFYFIASNNQNLETASISSTGIYTSLLNLTSFLPDGYTIDSVIDVSLFSINNDGLVAAVLYNSSNNTKFSITKTDTQGNKLWNITDSLQSTIQSDFVYLITQTASGDIDFVYVTEQSVGGQNNKTVIANNVFSATDGKLVKRTQIPKDGDIVGIYPLKSGGYIYITGGGKGGQDPLAAKSKIYRTNANGITDSVSIDINVLQCFSFCDNSSNFLFSIITRTTEDVLNSGVINVDFQQGLLWHTQFVSSSAIPVSIQAVSSGYIASGVDFEGIGFTTDLSTIIADSELFRAKLTTDGDIEWQSIGMQKGLAGTGAIQNSNGTISWMNAILIHSTYMNIALFKTDEKGEILK